MDMDAIPAAIGAADGWRRKPDGWWLDAPGADPLAMASVLFEAGARLVTMTAAARPGGEYRVVYHWDLEGRVLNIAVMTKEAALPSIAAVLPAADWIEREIHDYFAVRFAGRDLPPIFLAPGEAAGVLRWDLKWEGPEKGGRDRG
ncbi:MAG: NADH-quinone oxidoreductase subunit C [Acidobacteriota bacterium]